MHLSLESLLVLGIVGFYIYDSTYLYFYNEFIIKKGLKHSFKAQFISKKLNFLNKYLVIFEFFLPYQLVFKCSWRLNDFKNQVLSREDIENIQLITATLKPLQFVNIILFILILILLPIIFLLKLNYVILAITITTIYFLNLINIFYVISKRKKLKLSWSKVSQLALDTFLCPPFSLNLLRKISLNYAVKSEGTLLAKQILTKKGYQEFLNNILKDLKVLKSISNQESISKIEHKEQQLIASQDLSYKNE
ncbi:hypothetical protein ACG9XY_08850 [Acinetobacter seifertii]|uniref:hypothetical protein n=1 Tax=Acinetobacter seifertii TaxID=1530123 RepID=UPI00168CB45D|nr:hypothetical protein [Acinetobacter seifertii]QNY06681.1 hypothetical protein IC769_01475 [Acinetobacter seifertii]